MIKIFFLILGPGAAWERIAQARRGYFFILTTYLVPMLLLTTGIEGWGLIHWGKYQSQFDRTHQFMPRTIIIFEVMQFFALAATVIICAILILRIAQTFHARNTFLQAFTVAAYGLGPIFLLNWFDAFPQINPWLPWAIGIVMTIWIFYQGLPRVLEPDPTHAFGLYMASCFVVFLITGLVRTVTAMYLLGHVDIQHCWLGQKIGQLLAH
jgi:hypothetical protein